MRNKIKYNYSSSAKNKADRMLVKVKNFTGRDHCLTDMQKAIKINDSLLIAHIELSLFSGERFVIT